MQQILNSNEHNYAPSSQLHPKLVLRRKVRYKVIKNEIYILMNMEAFYHGGILDSYALSAKKRAQISPIMNFIFIE